MNLERVWPMLSKRMILINDASVLFDLLDLDLFNAYFHLGHRLFVTPQIIGEIRDEMQKSIINQYTQENLISIDSFGTFETINQLFDKFSGLSFADCSILESAIRNHGVIISSDMALRKISQLQDIEVKGLIWIIEELVNFGIMSKEVAISKLEQYVEINIRAPKVEINILINKLSST